VRSQPLNQEKFNFKISMSQLIIGLILTPAILAISVSYSNSLKEVQRETDYS